MALYIAIVICIFALVFSKNLIQESIIYNKSTRHHLRSVEKIVFILFILLLFALTGYRAVEIGNDTIQYVNYFESIEEKGVNSEYEIEMGYQYLCLFISKISSDPHVMLIVCALICYGIVGIVTYRNSNNLMFSLCLFFCMFFSVLTNIIRQGIAMAIVLLAYYAIKNKHNIIAILLILLAAAFHTSALLAFLLFFYKFIPKQPVIVVSLLAIVSILSATGLLSGFLSSILTEYAGYFESPNAGTGWLGISYYLLRNLVFYIFVYVAYRGKKDRNQKLVLATFVILLLMTGMGYSVNLFARASEYFLLIAVVELPNAFETGKIKNKNILMLITCFVMLAFFITALILRPEWNYLYPYRFWE